MKGIVLHSAQKEAINAFNLSLQKGNNKGAIIMATAAGKTIMSISMIKDYLRAHRSAKILFIAHLKQIWDQTKEEFDRYIPEATSSIYAGKGRDSSSSIILASVPTLNNDLIGRKIPFKRNEFDFIVVDEFHHSGADTWRTILNYFTPKVLLGMSCLKERGDDKEFLHLFDDNIVYELDTVSAIERNIIVPFKYYAVNTFPEPDYPLKINGQIYDERSQNRSLHIRSKDSKIIDAHFVKHTKKLVDKYTELAVGKKAIVFSPSIRHAIKIAKIFNKKEIPAVAIHSEVKTIRGSSQEEMDEKTNDFRDGKYMVACTIDKWLEGANFPDVGVGMFMRTTESWRIWCQARGRILRKSPGKEYGIIIDCVGSYKSIQIYTNQKIEEIIWLSYRLNRSIPQDMGNWNIRDIIDYDKKLKQEYSATLPESVLRGMPEGTKHKGVVNYNLGEFEIHTEEIDDIFYRTGELKPTRESIANAFSYLKEKLGRVPTGKEFYREYGASIEALSLLVH